jgi:hypothetical protein
LFSGLSESVFTLFQQRVAAVAEHIATWPNSLLPLGIGVGETTDGLQVRFMLLLHVHGTC